MLIQGSITNLLTVRSPLLNRAYYDLVNPCLGVLAVICTDLLILERVKELLLPEEVHFKDATVDQVPIGGETLQWRTLIKRRGICICQVLQRPRLTQVS